VDEAPETRAELARRHGVHASAITRALRAAAQAHARDAAHPAPPRPLNPGSPHEVWLPSQFDPWWAARPRRGRPRDDKEN
jgi:hypothetical protein